MEDVRKKLSCISIRLSIICPGCNSLIPINGVVSKVKCIKCGHIVKLKGEKYGWHNLLYLGNPTIDVFESSGRYNKNTGGFYSIKIEIENKWPRCSKCKYKFSLKDLHNKDIEKNKLICPECKTSKPLFAAPRSISKPYKCASYVVDGIVDSRTKHSKNIVTNKKGNAPMIFNCASCGGALNVDGTSRLVKCEFCENTNFIPEDLWLSLYSTPKAKTWYIIFKKEKKKKEVKIGEKIASVEKVYFEDKDVKITNSRVIIKGKIYSLPDITSVDMKVIPPNYYTAILPAVLGILLLIVSALTERIFATKTITSILYIIGFFLVGIGVFIGTNLQKSYILKSCTSSEETNVMESKDKAYIQNIIGTIKQAIIENKGESKPFVYG